MPAKKIAVIGGGAAGFMGAITAAERGARVYLFERGRQVLEKVRISGGGRCNVTHACFDPTVFIRNYPRGSRELLAPFTRFGAQEAMDWFESRGVALKVEADGRVFPVTDDSMCIVQCLQEAARNAGVTVVLGRRIDHIQNQSGRWHLGADIPDAFDAVLLAPGSSTGIWAILEQLGHTVVAPVPSLFTFNTRDVRLREMSGVSVPFARLSVAETRLQSEGPVLITHWGLSGPAVLRLSAWGARALASCAHRFCLKVNWVGLSRSEVLHGLRLCKQRFGRRSMGAHPGVEIPARLWHRVLQATGTDVSTRWADVQIAILDKLCDELCEATFDITGKSTFKEEFVTAGGVQLKEVDFRSFQSKVHPGLFLAGEVLDIDAITGGFNFQAAWTGGWIAGMAMTDGP
jgi:predicted Rossmann fold flavoprotein